MGIKTIQEPVKQTPVAGEADVVIAGAGISGLFAAFGAARAGAKTILIDRFGSVGGNLGPGLSQFLERPGSPRVAHGVKGLPAEFMRKVEKLIGQNPGDLPSEWPFQPDASIYVAFKMLQEAGVKLMLSTYTSNAIVEGDRVKGIFVENKSGRQAVLGRTVIDATGEASVAATVPVPVLPVTPGSGYEGYTESGGGIGLAFEIGGVDVDKYSEFRESKRVSSVDVSALDERELLLGYKVDPDDQRWIKEVLEPELGYSWGGYPPDMVPLIRQAWESGDFKYVQRIGPSTRVIMRPVLHHGPCRHGQVLLTIAEIFGDLDDPADGDSISRLEAGSRTYVYEVVYKFLKKYVPGFENAFLAQAAPFLGARRGRCIEAEYSVTEEDLRACRLFDDVIYRYADLRLKPAYCDFPYRSILPQKVNGLLVVGRSAYKPQGPRFRARIACMYIGQAAGIAAAMAKDAGVNERDLDIKTLQQVLLKANFYLGDKNRLKELGLG